MGVARVRLSNTRDQVARPVVHSKECTGGTQASDLAQIAGWSIMFLIRYTNPLTTKPTCVPPMFCDNNASHTSSALGSASQHTFASPPSTGNKPDTTRRNQKTSLWSQRAWARGRAGPGQQQQEQQHERAQGRETTRFVGGSIRTTLSLLQSLLR
jgi:hypothetical protein